jgi:hypothetical protein
MPDWKPEIRRRLAGVKLESARETAIIEELAQYLEDCYAELLSSGVTEAEAHQRTLAELRGSELLARELRRVERRFAPEPITLGTNRRTKMIADLWQDLRCCCADSQLGHWRQRCALFSGQRRAAQSAALPAA